MKSEPRRNATSRFVDLPPQRGPKRLIVEGYDDLQSVIGLMRAHVSWPNDPNAAPPIFIERGGSPKEILRGDYLPILLKSREITCLGVMLDADENPKGRYQRAHALCRTIFPSMPTEMPQAGLVVANDDGKRFGFWVMPDNATVGDLETFLGHLVPDQHEPSWQLAIRATAEAKVIGCGYRDTHIRKAQLYTWLAWQDPPAQIAGVALRNRVLNPTSPLAASFVRWFRALYEL